jgi:hypothetical protein
MHLLHEGMKMHTSLFAESYMIEKQVHHHGLATPYRPHNIQAARHCGAGLTPKHRKTAPTLWRPQLHIMRKLCQFFNHLLLGRVGV